MKAIRTLLALAGPLIACVGQANDYDLVIGNGRVMDPLTNTDTALHLGIRDGTIAGLSATPLQGKAFIDASGLVVAPGFIDLHAHGQDARSNGFQAADGVTTALELEIGVQPVNQWLASRAGRSRIHFGATASHLAARIKVLTGLDVLSLASLRDDTTVDTSYMSAVLTPEQRTRLIEVVDQGIRQGGLGIGIGITYTPSATRDEIYDMFRLAARYQVPVFTHMRNPQQTGNDLLAPLQEVLGNAAASGAPLHVVHINSSMDEAAPLGMELIRGARRNGIDVTTESYPYTAGSTRIESALFNDFQGDYGDLQWTATGERLTKETFDEYRAQGGWVIIHGRSEATNSWLVAQPDIMVASDGVPFVGDASHPRSAGTYARVLGHYSRDEQVLDLMTALRKMTIDPAQRLERISPAMARKGRIAIGADADITIFNAATVLDQATYTLPARTSAGIEHVLVGGVAVISNGRLVDDAFPGKAVVSAVE